MRIQRDAGVRVAALGAFRCAGRLDAFHAVVAFSFTTRPNWRPLPPPGRRQRNGRSTRAALVRVLCCFALRCAPLRRLLLVPGESSPPGRRR